MTSTAKNKRAALKEEMHQSFVQAALALIEEQGTAALSTRNLAKLTGYSYATLYNYFPNKSALFQYCIYEHLQRLNDYAMKPNSETTDDPKQQLKYLSRNVTDFFIQNPLSFELIFLVPLTEEPPEAIREALLTPTVIMAVRQALMAYFRSLNIPTSEYETITQVVLSHLVGRLMFFLKRTQEQDASAILAAIEKEIDWLLLSIERSACRE